jgi:hypothetical protein
VDPFLSLRAESQFIDQSDPALTRIINPILLTESAGVMKTLWKKERDEFSVRLGAAFREKLDREVLNVVSNEREMVTTVDGGGGVCERIQTRLPAHGCQLQIQALGL